MILEVIFIMLIVIAKNGKEVIDVNRVGRYAQSAEVDELQLMNMVFELQEKDRMLMWMQGYIDIVIEKLPSFAKDILQSRKVKWEDTMDYVREKFYSIVNEDEFIQATKKSRKEFAIYVMEKFPKYQSLIFRYYNGNLKESDFRKFVYQNRYSHKRYLL
jgi:hypothetical protein